MKFLDQVIAKFEKKKPVAVMARMLVANVISADSLDEIFNKHRKRQKDGDLQFSTVADMLGEVVFKIFPSINASYRERELGIAVKSVYNKLNGVETAVSRAIVQETAARKMEIIDKLGGKEEPLLPGFHTKIFDGNHLRRTDRRIGELRDLNVAPLPGKSLVVYDPEYRLAIDVFPCECGHASERTMLPQLLETVKAKDLLIGDRNFCTREFLFAVHAKHAKFIIRQHGQMPYTPKGRRRRIGEIETGIVYEQTIECTDALGDTKLFRRITVHLYEPTRDGEVEIHMVTNLPKRIGATRIANLYRTRWTVETAFQDMAENFEGEISTLGYPKAALFSFCMALVSYNIFSVLRSTVQVVHGRVAAVNLSVYYISLELATVSEGMSVLLDSGSWRQAYSHQTPAQMAAALKRVARNMKIKKYEKNPWTPKPKPKPTKNKTNRKHASTHKILKAARATA